jgi:hypothetical protein
MNKGGIIGIVLACSLAVAGCASGQQSARNSERYGGRDSLAQITTHDVVAMSRAGISDSTIVTVIKASGSYFALSADDVIALADSGVSDNVINAMIVSGEKMNEAEQATPVYVYPWYPYYVYDPFWDPWYYRGYGWYYPVYTFNFGFRARGFHGGFGVGHRGGVRHR